MTKNIMIRVFMDLKQYGDVIETARDRNIKADNDSDLIRKILFEYTEKIEAISFKLMRESDQSKEAQAAINEGEAVITSLRGEILEKNKFIEILENNLQRLKNVSKQRKKKGN